MPDKFLGSMNGGIIKKNKGLLLDMIGKLVKARSDNGRIDFPLDNKRIESVVSVEKAQHIETITAGRRNLESFFNPLPCIRNTGF